MRMLTLLSIAVTFLIPSVSFADQPMPMIDYKCINELGVEHFSASIKSYPYFADYLAPWRKNVIPENVNDRKAIIERYNLLFPEKYNYTCKLGNHTWQIEGTRAQPKAQGECGGQPSTKISLYMDGKPVLKNLDFEKSCFKNSENQMFPYIENFSIDRASGDSSILINLNDGNKNHVIFSQNQLSTIDSNVVACLIKNSPAANSFIISKKVEECSK